MDRRRRSFGVRSPVLACAAGAAVILLLLGVVGVAARTDTWFSDGETPDTAAGSVREFPLSAVGARFVRYVVAPERVREGVDSPAAPIVLANIDVENGVYQLGYEFSVSHDRAFASEGLLRCLLVEATSGVALLPQEPTIIRETDGRIAVAMSVELGLPAMTVQLRCFPEAAALSRTVLGDVTLYAVGLDPSSG